MKWLTKVRKTNVYSHKKKLGRAKKWISKETNFTLQFIHISRSVHCLYSDLFSTLQPLYNMVCYNMVLDITRFKDGSQKCIDYIEK